MVVRTRKAGIILGILIVAAGWVAKASLLVRWFDYGEINGIALLLFACTVVSLITGAVAVHRGKRGGISFSLHIVFACLACFLTHFIFVIPLALGIFVVISALVWPPKRQHELADETSI